MKVNFEDKKYFEVKISHNCPFTNQIVVIHIASQDRQTNLKFGLEKKILAFTVASKANYLTFRQMESISLWS